MLVDNEIMGWLGVDDPKEMDYHREIIFLAFTDDAASMSLLNLLPVALHLPFNHGMSVRYAISSKIMGEKNDRSLERIRWRRGELTPVDRHSILPPVGRIHGSRWQKDGPLLGIDRDIRHGTANQPRSMVLMIVQSLGWLRFYSVLQNLLFY
jgi:hypothetical protein